ncbi:MAG TPA: aspartyl protease family protein [Candidatus Limnocylindria bacterium]|nr:aspartyl protease family protein [Candidatus Limnocylindria bacterium]
MRLFAAVFAALTLVAAAPSWVVPRAGTAVTVPVTDQGDHLYVWLRINGSEPLHFAVDTAGGEMIDTAVATRLHLSLAPGTVTLGGIGAGNALARRTRVDDVQIGAAQLDDVPFLVMPIATSFGVAEGTRIDGVIGPVLLTHFTVTIDAAGGTMTLAPPASGPLGELPMRTFAGGHPTTACTVAGVPTRCTLDTGSRLTVTLLRPFLDAHPAIDAHATTAPGIEGFGIGGTARGRLGDVTIGLDGHQLTVVGDYTNQRVGAFASRAVGANVGEGVLRRFVITLDVARGRAHVVPSSAFADPERPDRSGLFLIRRDDATIVLDVRPGTPAALAGLRADDELVSIDGTPAAELGLDAIRARLRDPGDTPVRLRVRDASGVREVYLALTDYVHAAAA